jgi:drug/metabolite transporter (DMT)-like permease
MLAGLLYLGAGIGLAFYALTRRSASATSAEASLRLADLPWLAAAIVSGGVVGPILLMLGLSRTPASAAALLLNLEGLATLAIAWLVLKENVDRRLLAGAASILAGAALLSWDGGGVAFNLGALLVAFACLAWGVDNNLTRGISGADPVVIAMLKGWVAGGVNIALSLAFGASLPAAGSAP